MTRTVTLLTEEFSDWETALINAAGRSYFGFDTAFATPGGTPVMSAGGMLVTPNLAIEAIQLEGLDVLIVCGGNIWQTDQAPDVSALVKAAHDQGVIVAGICDGTRVLAQAGLLNTIRHTSNSPENLLDVPGYTGSAQYQDVPYAVADQRVVTAAGTAPVSFMAQILDTLGIGGEDLDEYLAMHAEEHSKRG